MTHIGQIIVDIQTGNDPGADADGPVYLGVGPREFRLAKQGNSFEANKPPDHFVLGNGPVGGAPNVKNPDDNDPSKSIERLEIDQILGGASFALAQDPTKAKAFNVYIRYESNNKWLLKSATARFISPPPGTGADQFDLTFTIQSIGPDGIWLGADYGKIVYLQP
jgi:hypothetical protein